MADDDPKALVFALCHEAGSLLTALRFHAAAPASEAGDDELRALANPLAVRVGALLTLIRPLLEGARNGEAVADTAETIERVERELADAGVDGIVTRLDPSRAKVRCDPELLRQLLIARALAVVEPGEAPVRLTLSSEPCGRGIAIGIEDDLPPRAEGTAPSGIALVDRVAGLVLTGFGGAVASERTPGGSRTRFELKTA